MKNKKGHVLLGVAYTHLGGTVLTLTIVKAIGMALVAACVWHIPAWEQAKANGTEAAYQAQQMWPQQLFAKLPGGNAPTKTVVVEPRGGYWEGKVIAKNK